MEKEQNTQNRNKKATLKEILMQIFRWNFFYFLGCLLLRRFMFCFKTKSCFLVFAENGGKTRDFQKGRLEHKLKRITSLSSPEYKPKFSSNLNENPLNIKRHFQNFQNKRISNFQHIFQHEFFGLFLLI
jgi:hypothetical protein